MQKWTDSERKPWTIAVVLFPQFSNHCLANAIEPFRAVNDISHQTYFQWQYLSLEGGLVTSSSGLAVMTEALMPNQLAPNQRATDFAMVISSYGYRNLVTARAKAQLRNLKSRTQILIGLDTGAWLLAEAGLLEGRKATIHRLVLNDFSERFLGIETEDARYIEDGDVITCGGAMAAFDLCLDLIGRYCGDALRLDVAMLLLFMAPQLNGDHRSLSYKSDDLIERAIALMDHNIEEPLSLTVLADSLGCDSKFLQRRCVQRLDASPGRLYRQRRLRFIRQLVEDTDLPIAEIALRGGFTNASAMTRAFKKHYGLAPLALRQGTGR